MAKNEEVLPQEKTWNKKEYIENKFSNRSINFYIDKSKLFLDISFYLVIAAFIFALINTYVVMTLPNTTSYYISSLDGKLYVNNLNQNKKEQLVKAITEIRQKQAQQNNQNKK